MSATAPDRPRRTPPPTETAARGARAEPRVARRALRFRCARVTPTARETAARGHRARTRSQSGRSATGARKYPRHRSRAHRRTARAVQRSGGEQVRLACSRASCVRGAPAAWNHSGLRRNPSGIIAAVKSLPQLYAALALCCAFAVVVARADVRRGRNDTRASHAERADGGGRVGARHARRRRCGCLHDTAQPRRPLGGGDRGAVGACRSRDDSRIEARGRTIHHAPARTSGGARRGQACASSPAPCT